jgi:hypothetical protein
LAAAARSLAPLGVDIAQGRRRASVFMVRVRFLYTPSLLSGEKILSFSSVGHFRVLASPLLSPRLHWRSSPQGPDGMVLVLVGANVAVYAFCRLAGPTIKMNNFMVSALTQWISRVAVDSTYIYLLPDGFVDA